MSRRAAALRRSPKSSPWPPSYTAWTTRVTRTANSTMATTLSLAEVRHRRPAAGSPAAGGAYRYSGGSRARACRRTTTQPRRPGRLSPWSSAPCLHRRSTDPPGKPSSAPASGSYRCGHWRRRWTTRPARPRCSSGSPAAAVPARVRGTRRRPRAQRALAAGAPAAAGFLARGRRRRCGRPGRADLVGARHRRPGRLRLRPAALGRRVRRTTGAAGVPADRFHVESFGW